MPQTYRILDLLPIPKTLILPLEVIQQQKNIYEPDVAFFKKYEISAELQSFLTPLFPFAFIAEYQISTAGLHMHKDRNRTECFNYMIDNGGADSKLAFYLDDKKTMIDSVHIKNSTWHWLNTTIFHKINGLGKNPRLSVTVTPLSAKIS